MLDLLFLCPVILVVGLLIFRKGVLVSGIAGLAAACTIIQACAPVTGGLSAVEALKGAWLSWNAVAIILAGLFLYRCLLATTETHPDGLPAESQADSADALFNVCFLIGPFVESATGFGVGNIVALGVISRLGFRGPQAVVLGLFSQMLVAWGGLGVGSTIGAGLAGIPVGTLALRTACICGPLLFGHLFVFWSLCIEAGRPRTRRQRLRDMAWVSLEATALVFANGILPMEIAGLAALAPLIAFRFILYRRKDGKRIGAVLKGAWPFILLTGLLVTTRVIPPLRDTLQTAFVLAPFANGAKFAPFYSPGFWLLGVGILVLAVGRKGYNFGRVTRATLVLGSTPAIATLIFVVMAHLLSVSGIAAHLAGSWRDLVGPAAVMTIPAFGAVAGFLSGSNTASNSMMMPVQAAMARQAGADVGWIAALQNASGSTFCMLSPIRVAASCAQLGLKSAESEVYGAVWKLGAVALSLLIACGILLH